MDLFFLVFFFALIVGLGAVGLWKGNPWLTMLACLFAIGLGGLVLSTDLRLPMVDSFHIVDTNATTTDITPEYTILSAQSDSLINSFGLLLLGGGLCFLVVTLYYAIWGRSGKVFE